jgi:hypothetical protein
MKRFTTLVLLLLACTVTQQSRGQTGWNIDSYEGFRASVNNQGNVSQIGWTTGNLGNAWDEGEWVPYLISIRNVDMSNLNFSPIRISYDFTSGNTDSRFVDLVRNLQVGLPGDAYYPLGVGTTSAYGWPTAAGTPYPLTTNAQLTAAQTNQNEYVWGSGTTAWSLLNLPDNQINRDLTTTAADPYGAIGTVTDAQRSFTITRADLIAAGVSPTYTGTLQIYFNLHLSQTYIWTLSLQSQFDAPPTDEWGGYLYGISPFNTDSRNGSGYVTGSSGHTIIVGPGGRTVPIPVPMAAIGEISGMKFFDANANGIKDPGEQGLPGWEIYISTIVGGTPIYITKITDNTGAYSLTTLPGGTYYISEEWQGPTPTSSPPANYPYAAFAQFTGLVPTPSTWDQSYPLLNSSINGGAAIGQATPAAGIALGYAPESWVVDLQMMAVQGNLNFGNFVPAPQCVVSPLVATICVGDTTTFTAARTAQGTPPYTVAWTGPTGWTPPAPSQSMTLTLTGGPAPAGVYTAVLTDANGLSSPGCSVTLQLYPQPTCSIAPAPPQNICEGGQTVFTGPPANATTHVASWAWSVSGNATISGSTTGQNVTVVAGTYSLGSSFVVTLTTKTSVAEGECENTCNYTYAITPMMVCPADLIVDCASLVPAPSTAAVTMNCANIQVAFVSDVISNQTGPNCYTITRTYSGVNGLASVLCSQTITVNDDEAPIVTTLAGALDATIECSDAAGITAALALFPAATDNCAAVPTMHLISDVTTPDLTCTNAYIRVRTWNFDDGCGNVSASFVQTITVEDNTAPVVTTLAGAFDATFECSNVAGITAALALFPVATDNCTTVPTIHLVSDVTTPDALCTNAYIRVRTWNFDDGCGNVSANFVQTITVEDNTAPVITTLAGALDVTLECSDATGIAAALAMVPVGTDNCLTIPNLNLISDVTTPSTTCANAYIQVRTWNFDDGCGNVSANFVQTITIEDNTAPVITTLAGALDATIECSNTAAITAALALFPAATDNCTTVPTMHLVSDVTTPHATCANAYVQVRTWNFDDGCGNVSANFVQTITVEDNTAPVVTTLAGALDATFDCLNTTGITAALALFPAATDNCTAVPTMHLVSDVTTPHATCANSYTRVRTWNFDDGCGNVSANYVQTITVEDNTAPVVTTLAGSLDATLECSNLTGITAALALFPAATDNCTTAPLMVLVSDITTPDVNCANAYIQVRTWNFDDGCGNVSANFVQTITVEDNTAPVITTLAGALDATFECSNLTGIAAALAMVPVATDNCAAVPNLNLISDVTTPDVLCANAYIQVRTWNFDDGCGNVSANYVQTITVEDNTAPVITTLAGALDAVLECSDLSGITAALAMVPVATDNCATIPNLNLISDVTTPSTTCANAYIQVRTWNFDDGCGNVSANFVQTITVEDNTAPVITTLAGALDATIECSNAAAITAALALFPAATDNCTTVPTMHLVSDVTTPHATCANAYVQVRTWNFDDGCGNVSANFVQTITVQDVTAPVITTLAGALDATLECSDAAGITAALALFPAATDNCTAVPTMHLVSDVTTPHATCANAYVQVRTWNFDDGCGNVSANYVQTITVEDNTAPVVTTLAGSLDATLECSNLTGITAALALFPAATDNCTTAPLMVLVSDITTADVNCANAYVQVRTWNFDDGCGNVSANFVQTITVEDNTAPVITTLAGALDATFECSNLTGIAAALAMVPVATDNCAAVPNLNLISDVTTPDVLCANAYIRVRTWNFDDGCGNVSANYVQTITVEDNTAPVITTLAGALDAVLECSDLSGIAAALAMVPAATDNCTAVPNLNLISDVTTPSTTCANAYIQVRTWNFDDGCGNVSANFVQTITVEDNTAPVITTLAGALDATIECSNAAAITAALALFPAATDNCTTVPTMHLVSNVTTPHATCANAYVQVRTWNFDDGCGNVSANFVQTITVEDNTAPVITTLAGALDATLECSNLSGITAALALFPAATDNCTAVPTMHLVSDVTTPDALCANAYIRVRTWNFDDGCGNVSANFVQTITVEDNTAPVVTTLAGSLDATLECSNLTGITAALALFPAATDNCTTAPLMVLVSDITTPDANCANAYIQVRTWNFDDGCGNVSANFVQTITVEDNTAPVITTLAGALDATFECSNLTGISAALAMVPVATDNCTAVPNLNLISDVTTPDVLCANAYIRVRTWNFDDGCGNVSANYVQTITVEDNTAPVITTLAGALNATLECSDLSGIAAAVAMVPAATDNCTAVPNLNLISDVTTPSAICANAYIQVRTWNFDDGCGNVSANFVQTITVEDNTAPVITTLAGALDATLECTDAAGIAAMLVLVPSATDNCTTVLNLNVVSDITTPDALCANAYIRVRTWNFDDGCGNVSANFVQTITVEDNTAPVITTLAGALDATLECSDLAGIAAAVALMPVATDNCTLIPTMNLVSDVTTPDALCANAYIRVRTWNFDDGCGNVSPNFVQTITVEDNTAPVITTVAGSLDITVECSNVAGISAATALIPAFIDNCGTSSLSLNVQSDVIIPSATCNSAYVQVRTWNVSDACGNVSANFVQTITVVDTQAPIWINLPPTNVVVDCATTTIPFWTPVLGVDYSDNCDPNPVLSNPISHNIVPQLDGTKWHIRSWKLVDNCLNESVVVTQTIIESRCQFASLTQGAYGNANGRWCGNGLRRLDLLNLLLTTPLVVGIPNSSGGSFTFGIGQGACVIQYLPGGGPSAVLPPNDYSLGTNCNILGGTFNQVRNGRFRNTLLAQTITFALNLRLDPYLGTDLKLPSASTPYLWTLESNYVNGVCLDGDDTEVPNSAQSWLIPPSVITAMLQVFSPRTDLYLSDLLAFANMALAGQNTYGASLNDIASALDAYNQGFDEARFFGGYHAMPAPKTAVREVVADDFVLHQNHPNPFNPSTTITFTIPEDCSVRLSVYNALGVEIDVLIDHSVTAGTHSVNWNSSSANSELPSGVYTYRIHALGSDGKEYHDVRKMMLVR